MRSLSFLVVTALAGGLVGPVQAMEADRDAAGVVAHEQEEHEALRASTFASTGSCGVERWSVKTGTDPDAHLVDLSQPVGSTINALDSLTPPSALPADSRVQPTETTAFVIDATLTEYKLESDSDYHLVLTDAQGHTMIAEIPDPQCVGAGSPFAAGIQNARTEFDSKYAVTGSFHSVSIPVRVTGVGFFDFDHGQTGVAPNAIELHPVVDIVFNPTSGGDVPPVSSFSDSVSGLSVAFVNTSTDSDGTITSSKWTFGDGQTATATSPTHVYAAAGTYTVTLTVTDNAGLSTAKSATLTVAGPTQQQLLDNTGFETGTASPWTMSSGTLCSNSTCSGETAHGGSWYAWLDGYGSSHTDTVSQAVTVPNGTSATLSFFLHVDTAETTQSTAYDKLRVQVVNASGSTATVATYSNLDAGAGYVSKVIDLSAYVGQAITVKFVGTEDSSQQTSFVIDDLTLDVQ